MSTTPPTNMPTHTVHYVAEPCCRQCPDEIHNHFDCPACETLDAGTTAYFRLCAGDMFECQHCQTAFTVVEIVPAGSQMELAEA